MKVLPFWIPPYWISHFRLSFTTFKVDSLDRWTSKTLISLFKLCFYVACKLRYMCLSSSSGLESAILNFYFQSARTVFPMSHMDRIFKDLSTMYYKLYYSPSKAIIQGVVTTTSPSICNVVKSGYFFGGLMHNDCYL